jgi:Lipocalin-like domain
MSRDKPEVVGVWILRSCHLEVQETGQRFDPFGPNPRGVLIIHTDGRMATMTTPRDQQKPLTDVERAAAFQSLVAYSGKYRLDPPDRFVTTVDVAWFQPWIGTDQTRTYRISGDTLDIFTAPMRTPWTEGFAIGVLSWVREGSAAANVTSPVG